MDDNTVIKVTNLSKKFTRSIKRSMLYGSTDIAKSMVGIRPDTSELRKGEFWSLQDINFELKKGEGLGIIGQNGSGKSTLLRIINGIFPPDKGKVEIRGKIGALIAVGAGFHPHLTGRENIYLNGIILGMSKKEIDSKFNDIIKFADIGEFIDAPVATYSSGMSVRLGFSIAIHSEPEILLADEVLAVGDLSFALKCYRKIAEYRKNGGTIILVSHGMQLVRNICQHVLWIDKGVVKEYGDTQYVCDLYEKFMFEKDRTSVDELGIKINNDPSVRIENVEFLKENKVTKSFKVDDPFTIRINYKTEREVKKPIFTFGILNPENITLISNYSNYETKFEENTIKGTGFIEYSLEKLYLKPGSYTCTVTLAEDELANVLDWHEKSYSFIVESNGTVAFGLVQMPGKWKLN